MKYGYNLILALIAALTLTGCGSHHRTRGSRHNREASVVAVMPGASKLESQIVKEAYTWMGTPYKYAGAEKGKGTDCSGMVLRVYEEVCGVKLPRNSAKQAEFCRRLKPRDVRSGDLVFFATGKDSKRISHVGIMIDGESFIHASTSKGVVVSKVTTPYYERTFIQYGRVPY